ncbi:alpha/beta hydrolase family protein [Streptomyces sp. NPDC059063]|uniref:alpha/beta hydrolase family protein n=1 Tax=unclassified Streptomyces TaxID=2593676 RepID=UPI003681B637
MSVAGTLPDAFTRTWSTLTTLRSRMSFRFSAAGRSAAALVSDGRGFLFCEYWDLVGGTSKSGTPGCRPVPEFRINALQDGERTAPPYDAVPFDDSSVLVVGPESVVQVAPTGVVSPAGRLPFRPSVIAPAPDGSRSVLFLGREDGAAWSAWRWGEGAGLVGPLYVLPALHPRGGGWLDPGARRYALNVRSAEGQTTSPAVLDVETGALSRLPLVAPSDHDLVWHTAPRAGEVLLVTNREGRRELCLHGPHGSRALRSPHQMEGTVVPLALHPCGDLVLLNESDGLRQRLAVLDTRQDTVLRLPDPPECAIGAAAWAEQSPESTAVWALAVGPGLPPRMLGATVAPSGRASGWRELRDGTEAGEHTGWAPGRLERLPGSDGDIEVVVCGHEDWRSAPQVAIALHGGPADQWSLKFSQLFQLFAAHGITVIAPNPRGSTGYGDRFQRAIVGAWGGPDLADVVALSRHVHAQRGAERPLLLYGASYGAFLALLATAAVPALWARTLAVSPMLSADRLYLEAKDSVRAMIDRLGGRTVLADAHGPRDMLSRASRLTTPLALIHGQNDTVIPPSHSRRLVAELERLGRTRGVDFHHLEVAGAGHSPLDGSAELHRTAAQYLAFGIWPA